MKQYFILIFFLALISCSIEKYDSKIQEDVAFLADDKLEGRGTGTEGERLASEYIANRFKKLGVEPKGDKSYFQEFNFKPKLGPHSEVKFINQKEDGSITGRNVLGFIDNKAENTVVIGAHYDHLGYGNEGSLYRGEKAIHNGADDNASGVAVMLNLAGKLKKENTNNNYLFMAFSGEEMGLLGSNYFVKNATVDANKINYMINMDMVGRLKDSTLAVYGTGTSPIWRQTISSLNDDFNLVEKESGVGPSDHTSFYLNDIPVLHFFTGQHEDYHKPSDDQELLNYDGMYQISDYIFSIVSDLDNNGKLVFKKTINESESAPRFKVTLGVIPDYLFEGKGMRIDGVSDGKSAAKAGIMKGDVVVKMGSIDIVDMMSYMTGLSKFEKGNSTTVEVLRGGKIVEVKVTF